MPDSGFRAVLLAALLTACGSSSPSAPTTVYGTCLGQGSLSARVDGVAWTAACVQAVNEPTLGRFTVSGWSRDGTQGLSLTIVAAQPGDYSLGGPTPSSGTYPYSTASLTRNCQPHPGPPCLTWFVAPCCGQPDGNGSGSVTLTRVSQTGASGSFSLDLVPNSASGATESKTIRNGVFTATF